MVGITGFKPGAIERVRSPPRLRIDLNCGGTQSPTSAYKNATHHKVSRKISPMKQEYPYQSELSLVHLRCSSTMLARGAMQDPLSRALPASSPCETCALLWSTRGAMHIKPHIAMQAKSSCISVGLSLLSKGLRGGKSRRLRVESLLRHMLQSARSKRPHRTALLWTQVQRLPDQISSSIYAHIGWFAPPLERVERRDVTK